MIANSRTPFFLHRHSTIVAGMTALAVILLFVPIPSGAVPVTFLITGEIDAVAVGGAPPGLTPGTSFSGQYTFDSATAPIFGIQNANYFHVGPPYGFRLGFPSGSIMSENFVISVGNEFTIGPLLPFDFYEVLSAENTHSFGPAFQVTSIRWLLTGAPGVNPGPFSSIFDYPIEPFPLSDFDFQQLTIEGSCGNGCGPFVVHGHVTRFLPVPEPGGLLLLGSGLLLACASRAQRQR